MCWNGDGVIEDEREAYIWYAANGDEDAANSLRVVDWGLDGAEIKSARLEAKRRLEAIRQRD